MSDPFTFEELTDRDLSILDHYVWGKDVLATPLTAQVRDAIAEETLLRRRQIDTEIERRKQLPRTFKTNECFKSTIGSEVARLTGANRV